MKPNSRRARPRPRDEEARRYLQHGMALERSGNLREAAKAYRSVIELQPRNVAVLSKYGVLLRLLDEVEESRAVLERAVKIDPRYAEAHLFLASVQKLYREPEKALESYQRAAWADPREVRAHIGMFGVYNQMNKLEKAEEALRTALDVNPADPTVRVMLARLYRRKGETKQAIDLVNQVLTERIPDEARHRAGFELGRNLEAIGDYPGAWEAIRQANAVQAGTPMSKAVDTRAWLKLINDSHSFTAEQFQRWAKDPPADDSPGPVLLVGFPRSGTTMTEQILGAHPAISVSDELDLFTPMYRALFPDWDDSVSLVPQLEAASRDNLAAARRVYRSEVEKVLRTKKGATVLIDKNPMNIVALGIVSRVFPDARIIVAMRDPRDVCLSCFFQEFVPNPSNIYFFTPEGTLEMYRLVMGLWIAMRDRLELRVLESRYETITVDFENRARQLIEFVGLPWDDGVLQFHKGSERRYVSTPSFEAITSPVHTRAQGKWHRFEQQLAPILEGLAPFVREFGYEL